jgi:hypothetical protein
MGFPVIAPIEQPDAAYEQLARLPAAEIERRRNEFPNAV